MTKPLFLAGKKIDPNSPTAFPDLVEHVSKLTDTLFDFMRNGVDIEENMSSYYYETTVVSGLSFSIPPKNKDQVLMGAIPVYTSGFGVDKYSVTNSGNSLSVTLEFNQNQVASFVRFLCFAR